MNRKEATLVLRELLDECDGALLTSGVSLSPYAPGSYQLVISCQLDAFLRKCINTVATRHTLKVKEQHGTVAIYREAHT
jgi:hypothetical protein